MTRRACRTRITAAGRATASRPAAQLGIMRSRYGYAYCGSGPLFGTMGNRCVVAGGSVAKARAMPPRMRSERMSPKACWSQCAMLVGRRAMV